jgi:hypothetical protein
MKNSVELLVVLMIFWTVFVVLYILIGQASAISDNGNLLKDAKSGAQAEVIDDTPPETEPSKFVSDNTRQVDLIYTGREVALKYDESHRFFVSIQKVRYFDLWLPESLCTPTRALKS